MVLNVPVENLTVEHGRTAHSPWLTEDLEEPSTETRVHLAYCKRPTPRAVTMESGGDS